jgi:hypothetical protein
MISDDARFERRLVSHTYEAPSGAIVIVKRVPAEVYVSEDGAEQVNYSQDVAEALYDIIRIALASADPDKPAVCSFDNKPALPEADYEIEFDGPGAVFNNASLQTWRRVLDKMYNSYKYAARSIEERVTQFPTVAYMTSGSIAIGIRAGEQKALFDLDLPQAGPIDKAMRMLLAASLWLDDEGSIPTDIAEDEAALETLLRAVEELSPSSGSNEFRLVRVGTQETAHFTPGKRAKARQCRIDLRLRNAEARQLDLIGTISKLEDIGRVSLRSVLPTREWRRKSATCTFNVEELLSTVLENFGKVVRVAAIEERIAGRWSGRPEAIAIERYDEGEPDSPPQVFEDYDLFRD